MTDNKKQVILKGQTWRSVSKIADFLNSIRLSASKRVFGSNGTNSHSSRSHHVFQIKIHSTDKLSKPRVSLLNIVDLAGSERRSVQQASQSKSIAPISKLSKSVQISAEELRLKQIEEEGISINKSLTTLGRIFAILSDRKAKEKQPLPYRECKLTRIL